MLIDWFTVIAQTLNFIILVWLLKRFLYKPILKAIDAREEHIREQLEKAKLKKEEATEEQQAFLKKNEEIENRKATLLKEAAEYAGEKRRQMLEEARKEAMQLRTQLEASVKEEQEDLMREVAARTQQEVFAIARKVLKDLASDSLEAHMATAFVNRLKQLEKPQKEVLLKALQESNEKVVIKSAFELPLSQKQQIEQEIEKLIPEPVNSRFEIASHMISGVELTAGGYKMAWSVTDYLTTLEKQLTEVLNHQPATNPDKI